MSRKRRKSVVYHRAYAECRFVAGKPDAVCREEAERVEAEGLGKTARRTPRLVSPEAAAKRLKSAQPEAIVDELPPWVKPFAEYMAKDAPLAKGKPTPRDIVKAYLLTKSSIQRQAVGLPTFCAATFPGLRDKLHGPDVRPEDAMAELLLTPTGKAYLDDAERGVFNEEAAKQIADAFACFGMVYPSAGADLSDPKTLKRNKSLFIADLKRAPRLAVQADTWCLGVQKNVKSASGKVRRAEAPKTVTCFGTRKQAEQAWKRRCKGKKRCSWTVIPPISHIVSHPDPEVYYKWASKYLHGVGAAKVGFFASLLGRGDIPTFDAREIQLWYRYPGKDPHPEWPDVVRLKERLEAFPMKLPERFQPYRPHLVHHALWDQYPSKGPPSQTTHEELIEAMQFAGPKRRKRKKKAKKPARRKAAAVAAARAQRARGGAHTDKRNRRNRLKRQWRDEEY